MIDSYTLGLLDEYKKYDYLNQDSKNLLVKIFVSYIKPYFLFKSEILTPIHLGRAVAKEISKDGIITGDDLKWLFEKCIGDDDFEGNISNVNRRVGFLTGTYFAWKNYERIGNPEYFGSFGYRRLFDPDFLENLKNYDAIIPKSEGFSQNSIKEQFITMHGKKLYSLMLNCIKTVHDSDVSMFLDYLEEPRGYFREIYVLKKELFFNFCEWIFPALTFLLSADENTYRLNLAEKNNLLEKRKKFQLNMTKEEFNLYLMREIAFIIERLSGFYLYKLTKNKTLKVLEQKVITVEDDKIISLELLKNNNICNLEKHIRKLQNKYIIPIESDDSFSENVTFVSVVNDYNIYEKYISKNPALTRFSNIGFVDLSNADDNIAIPKRYNEFLNNWNYKNESWFIFCHADWEVADNINRKIKTFDKNKIYGPAGSVFVKFKGFYDRIVCGFVYETRRNEKDFKIIHNSDTYTYPFQKADTLDCLCMIVHSSLIQKHNLRFDDNLTWNLYIEDFCIQAQKYFNIEINTFDIESYHHSDASYKPLPSSYYFDWEYLNKKYPDDIYAGTCSSIGSRQVKYASDAQKLLYKLHKNILNKK